MILIGHALDRLRELPENSVQCVATSPPYWGLRDYGVEGQLGLEKTPQEFVANMTAVFEEVRRVLKPDGTCWVNMGDTYSPDGKQGGGGGCKNYTSVAGGYNRTKSNIGIPSKNLIGVPWRLAFALQDAGWILRSDIIWSKPSPMPESVRDRPTKAHEYIFLLSKSARYYYDADAIAEPVTPSTIARVSQPNWENQEGSERVPGKANGNMKAVVKLPRFGGAKYGDSDDPHHQTKSGNEYAGSDTRNARTVWEIATQPRKDAHFATFPDELPRRCIMAGSREGDTVLDPFGGSGTTCAVAERLGRKWIYIDLNPEYAELAMKRIAAETPSLFKETAA